MDVFTRRATGNRHKAGLVWRCSLWNGVIRSPSRLISNGLRGGTAGPCLSAKNNDSDGTELVLPGIASQVKRLWRRVGMKGDRRAL